MLYGCGCLSIAAWGDVLSSSVAEVQTQFKSPSVLYIHSGILPSVVVAAVRLNIPVLYAVDSDAESADGVSALLFSALLKYCSAAELTKVVTDVTKPPVKGALIQRVCATPQHCFIPLLAAPHVRSLFNVVHRESNMVRCF